MFDINRTQVNLSLMALDPLTALNAAINGKELAFDFTLVENTGEQRGAVHARSVTSGVIESVSQVWPKQVYSLSHIALPFPRHDTLYGPIKSSLRHRVQIGAGASKGEGGVLSVTSSQILRQKWNPFFEFMTAKMDNLITD